MGAAKGNKHAKGNKGGRPSRYSSPEELQSKVDEYFNDGANRRKIITKSGQEVEMPYLTVTGLAYYLGFESRQSFYDYEKHDEFSYIIKKARLRIEMMYEEMLVMGLPTGPIFALKNMGWRDKQEVEHSGDAPTNINIIVDSNDTAETLKRLRNADSTTDERV